MQVTINGEPHGLNDGLTIDQLVQHLGLATRRIAVEVNRQIVAREGYATHMLADGDEVEIVHFVGGG